MATIRYWRGTDVAPEMVTKAITAGAQRTSMRLVLGQEMPTLNSVK